VLLFYAQWAMASLELRRDVLASDEFKRRFGGRFGLAEFDATDESAAGTKAVLERFDVQTVPTLIIVDRQGSEVRRFTQFVEMAALAPALEEAEAR
jgi:thiol:disulfide interchange protein